MSDIGDLGLPSYPTLPASLPSDPTEHEQPHFASLPPTTSNNNNSTTWGIPSPSSHPPGRGGIETADNVGNPFHSMEITSPLLSFQGQNVTTSSVYPRTSSPYSTLEDIPNSISHIPPSITSNMNSEYAASGGLSSMGESVVPQSYQGVGVAPQSYQGTGVAPESYQSSMSHQFTVSGSPLLPAATMDSPRSTSYMNECIPSRELPPHDSVGNSAASMAHRVQDLEKLCAKLQRERAYMEEMFGRQRKSFMNQMAHSDAELSMCKQKIDSYAEEVRELSVHVMTKDEQLKDCTIAAGITEASIREMFDADRVKYEEEIASLRKIVSGEYSIASM